MEISRTDRPASTILLVERDPLMLTAMASVLNMQGHRAILARTEDVALHAIDADQLDVIILSIQDLPSGCEFANRLRSSHRNQDVPIIFIVPELSPAWTSQLHSHGGVYSLLQPVDPHDLIDLVERALWLPHVANGKIAAPNMQRNSSRDWIRLD
jgi:DNA-binding response OmpR family regulator